MPQRAQSPGQECQHSGGKEHAWVTNPELVQLCYPAAIPGWLAEWAPGRSSTLAFRFAARLGIDSGQWLSNLRRDTSPERVRTMYSLRAETRWGARLPRIFPAQALDWGKGQGQGQDTDASGPVTSQDVAQAISDMATLAQAQAPSGQAQAPSEQAQAPSEQDRAPSEQDRADGSTLHDGLPGRRGAMRETLASWFRNCVPHRHCACCQASAECVNLLHHPA